MNENVYKMVFIYLGIFLHILNVKNCETFYGCNFIWIRKDEVYSKWVKLFPEYL